jgi:hypothetical protein
VRPVQLTFFKLLALMLLVPTTACTLSSRTRAANPQAMQDHHATIALSPITGDELRSLIAGKIMTRRVAAQDDTVTVSSGFAETFDYDYTYSQITEQWQTFGTYRIEGNAFCIHVKRVKDRCRRMFRDSSDNYYVVYFDMPSITVPVDLK